MREIGDAEFEGIIALGPRDRYQHFVAQVADWEEVWSLKGKGGWVLAEQDGDELVPMWPHPRYAQACARGGWADAEPESVTLAECKNEWLAHLERQERLVAVFPTPAGNGIPVTAAQLRRDLEEAAGEYE